MRYAARKTIFYLFYKIITDKYVNITPAINILATALHGAKSFQLLVCNYLTLHIGIDKSNCALHGSYYVTSFNVKREHERQMVRGSIWCSITPPQDTFNTIYTGGFFQKFNMVLTDETLFVESEIAPAASVYVYCNIIKVV